MSEFIHSSSRPLTSIGLFKSALDQAAKLAAPTTTRPRKGKAPQQTAATTAAAKIKPYLEQAMLDVPCVAKQYTGEAYAEFLRSSSSSHPGSVANAVFPSTDVGPDGALWATTGGVRNVLVQLGMKFYSSVIDGPTFKNNEASTLISKLGVHKRLDDAPTVTTLSRELLSAVSEAKIELLIQVVICMPTVAESARPAPVEFFQDSGGLLRLVLFVDRDNLGKLLTSRKAVELCIVISRESETVRSRVFPCVPHDGVLTDFHRQLTDGEEEGGTGGEEAAKRGEGRWGGWGNP